MSISQLYGPDELFESVSLTEFRPGQICWVPVPNLDPIPRILDVQRKSPEEHDMVRFELREANQRDDFKKRDRSLPVKHINLRSNEELLTQRAKKRPSIILAAGVECYPDMAKILKQRGKKHQQQDCLFVVPCYSVQKEPFDSGFIPEMVARIQCLMYRQFFYIPRSSEFSELVARFDRIQVIIDRSPAAIEPSRVCLTEEIYHLFLSIFLYCISGKTNENLDALKDILQESYPS